MDDNNTAKSYSDVQMELALSRTLLAFDRTLLAWIRTAISLLGFGFTLAKFVHGYLASGAMRGINPESPRAVGVALIVLGLGSLVGGVVEHYKAVTSIKKTLKVSVWSPALVTAIALSCLGIYLAIDIFVGIP